jgi:hypothetical protein
VHCLSACVHVTRACATSGLACSRAHCPTTNPQCLTIAQKERYQKIDATLRFENYVCGLVLLVVMGGITAFFVLVLQGKIAGGSNN